MANKTTAVNLDDVEEADLDGDELDELDRPIDFEKIKGTKLVPAGEYNLRVEGANAALSKTGAQPKVVFRCFILSGEQEGVTVFLDLSLAPGAAGRTKNLLVGMGMPSDAKWSPKKIAAEAKGWEFYGILDVEQSDGINDRTKRPYDPRNKLIAASSEPQYDEA